MQPAVFIALFMVLLIFGIMIMMLTRYKRCPADSIMVIYGKTPDGSGIRCINGGTAFIWPLFQSYGFLSLKPMQIGTELRDMRTESGERVDISAHATIAVGTEEHLMQNSAKRLFGESREESRKQAEDMLEGSLKKSLLSVSAETIMQDSALFAKNAEKGVEETLNQLGITILHCEIGVSL